MIKTKILIAEDYIISSLALQYLLELWGYEICGKVLSGEEAIEKAEQERPNIILMDTNLKGKINGIEAAGKIRSHFGIPVILTTAYSDSETWEAAKTAKPAGYFVKPLDFYALRLTIDSIVQGNNGDLLRKKKKPLSYCKA